MSAIHAWRVKPCVLRAQKASSVKYNAQLPLVKPLAGVTPGLITIADAGALMSVSDTPLLSFAYLPPDAPLYK